MSNGSAGDSRGSESGRRRSAAPRNRWAWLLLALTVAVYAGAFFRLWQQPGERRFQIETVVVAASSTQRPVYQSQFLPKGGVASVHAATAVALPDGGLRAFWYGGSREGAADVAIFSSVYTPHDDRWSPAEVIVDRLEAQRGLGRKLRKLGNPVAGRDGQGRLWLYFVSVSFGGWSGSGINAIWSGDEGRTWSAPRRLVTSPFLNLSNLVKAAPVRYADETVGLPVYHEMFGKFGELLRLDRQGRVVGKTRMSWGRDSLQPVVLPWSANEAVAFMRYAGEPPKRVLALYTRDAGGSWSEPVKTELPNPNSAVDALRLADGSLLMAFNNSDNNREDLSLAWSGDQGRSWRVVHVVDRVESKPAQGMPEYSYPWLTRDAGGDIHVFYTWRRERIKHVRFNPAWLRQRLP